MVAVLNNAPLPLSTPVVRGKRAEFTKGKKDPLEGLMTEPWIECFSQIIATLEKAPARVKSVELTEQSASIGATDFSGGTLSAGLYDISVYARITQAASVSSSLTIALDWTDGGVTPSYSWPAVTGNTTASVLTGPPVRIHIQNLSPVRYIVTYASVGGTPMKFSLYLTLSEVQA